MLDVGATPIVGGLVSVGLLNQMFQQIAESLPLGSTVTSDPRRTAAIKSLALAMRRDGEAPWLALSVSGNWTVEGVRSQFDAVFRVKMLLVSGDRPRLGLTVAEFVTLEGPDSGEWPIIEEHVQKSVNLALDGLSLDLLKFPVEHLNRASGGDLEPALTYSSKASKLLAGIPGSSEDAVALILALPALSETGTLVPAPRPQALKNQVAPDGQSFLRTGNDLCVCYNRALLDGSLERASESFKGESFPPAVVQRLLLKTEGEQLRLELAACIEIDWWVDQSVTVSGPVPIRMPRGVRTIQVDTWDLDVHLPDRCTRSFARTLGYPVPGELAVQLIVRDQLQREIAVLGEGFEFPSDWLTLRDGSVVTLFSSPDGSRMEGGHLLLFGHGFITPFTSEITDGWYHLRRKSFYQFAIAGGRVLSVAELVRLMDAGVIRIPGVQTVGGKYLRSVPDGTTGNNLLERFARHRA